MLAAAMYGASVAVETPSRILRRVLQQEQDAEGLDDLPSLPNVDITGEHSDFDSPAPPTPANKAPRRILSSPALTPDAPSPPVHPSTQCSVITGSSRTVRPGVRSSTSSPSIRSSPSSRVRRTVPSPVIEDDSKEEVDLPEEGEEDSLESSGDSLDASPSHVQLRRGGGNGGVHRRKLPSLSSASSFSAASSGLPSPPSHDYLSSPEKSHRERSVSILSQSMVEAPATEDELTREFELPSEILPSSPFPPAHTPLPNRPQRKSALAQVTPGPDSTSPSDHTSPGDFETPRPAPNSIDAERRKTHVLNTLRMTAVRSAARARIAKGTPFIRRTAAELSDEASESDATSSSQDLTTFQRVNASMPDVGAGAEGEAAGPAGRFNGGKLNAYLHTLNTHLTEENQALAHELEVAQAELERIRDGDEDEDEGSPALIEALRNEVEDLRALRETEIAADAARVDDLLSELEKRDRALHEQEANFNDKMERLEKELTAVMQDQEAQLEEARAQINARTEPSFRASQDARFQDAQRRANEAQGELNALRTERDELARLLDDAENEHATPDHRMHLAHEQVERLKSQLANKEGQLRAADERAQDDAEAIENLRTEVEDAQRLPRQLETLRKQLADAQGDRQRALDEVRSVRKQLERRDDDAALALDDATAPLQSQLRAAETEQRRLLDDAASLRRQLREEREQRASQAKDGDAQRHLAREADQLRQRLSDRDAEIAFLNSQAAERDALVSSARREAGRLRALHESPEAIGDKDAKIAELEASKNELARRLRMAETRTGAATPAAKSFAFRSVVGIPTPRTPGFYLRNMSAFDPTVDPEQTIAPLLEQIAALEAEIEQLRQQLEKANRQIDEKVDKLHSASLDRIDVASDLSAAKRKIADLEAQLERTLAQRRDGVGSSRANDGRELEAAKREIAGLETELRTMRSKVRDLVAEQDTTMRLQATTEEELHRVKIQLERRRGESGKQDELLDNLRAMNEYAERLAADLARARKHNDELQRDRADLVIGIDDLRHDLHRVRTDAASLGRDLGAVKRGTVFSSTGRDEAKSLLTMIRYLKAKYTREANLRADLAHQKQYLALMVREKQTSIEATRMTLSRFGLSPPDDPLRPPLTLRAVAHVVVAVIRMQKASERWKATTDSKTALRDAWVGLRGRPWTP